MPATPRPTSRRGWPPSPSAPWLASRLDAAAATAPCLEEVDLAGLLAEECARAGAELDAQACLVTGDPKLLRRMVRNLLENALRYGGGSAVGARLAAAGPGEIMLDVCDGGPGIPEQERERVFEPFYRIAGSSEMAGGVGLGLALVRQIARHHGGEVRCVPIDGGSCLRVTLPQAR